MKSYSGGFSTELIALQRIALATPAAQVWRTDVDLSTLTVRMRNKLVRACDTGVLVGSANTMELLLRLGTVTGAKFSYVNTLGFLHSPSALHDETAALRTGLAVAKAAGVVWYREVRNPRFGPTLRPAKGIGELYFHSMIKRLVVQEEGNIQPRLALKQLILDGASVPISINVMSQKRQKRRK